VGACWGPAACRSTRGSSACPTGVRRLAWGLRLNLQIPDDEGKLEIMRQRARSLDSELPEDVQNYVLKHGRRDMASLLGVVEKLKDAAFAGKRKITVPLAREILNEKGSE